MNIKLIREQWAVYEALVSFETIQRALTRPQSLLDEEIEVILPNIELAADGPVVRSLILLSRSYIGEVRLTGELEDFDFGLRTLLGNYRVSIGQHEVVRNAAEIEQAKSRGEEPPSQEKTVYQTATVTLLHTMFVMGMTTKMSYFGDKRDEWLKRIKTNIPVDTLKRNTGN